MQMLEDRVFIRPEPPKPTEAGIVAPPEHIADIRIGKVLSAGPGRLCRNGSRAGMSVKEGDRVLYGFYAGTPVETDHGECVILSESELLGVL